MYDLIKYAPCIILSLTINKGQSSIKPNSHKNLK